MADDLTAARVAKDAAYAERNQLVRALSKLYPASLERHDGEGGEDGWRWLVVIDLPTGQASWHIHDSELPNFTHLRMCEGRAWDGHTTEEKYARLERLPRAKDALVCELPEIETMRDGLLWKVIRRERIYGDAIMYAGRNWYPRHVAGPFWSKRTALRAEADIRREIRDAWYVALTPARSKTEIGA